MSTVTVSARRAGAAVVLLAAAAALLLSVAVRTEVLHVSRVLTGSMDPVVPAGALVTSRPVDAASIVPGDVVMYVPPAPFVTGGTPVAHRVTAVERENGDVLVRTKGDANPVEDPWTLNASRSTVHEVTWSSATAGRVADLVARGGGSLLLTVVVGLVALRALALLWRPRRDRHGSSGLRWLHDAAA